MEIESGAILKGKVTGIAKFGAFVELAPGKSGLVYISEISGNFVKEVSDYLAIGQEVLVKVINIDASGRINLSIKQAEAPVPRPVYSPAPTPSPVSFQNEYGSFADPSFEDKLKRFMKDSDSKMLDIRRQSEKRGSKRRSGR